MTEDYREVNAREGRAVYLPGKEAEKLFAEAEAEARAAERARHTHRLNVCELDLTDQVDRLNELQGLVYRAQAVFEGINSLDLPEPFIGAVSEFGAIAMGHAAEVFAEQAVMFATAQQRNLEELPEPSPEPATPPRKGTR